MGIATKFKELFIDVYKAPMQQKALNSEFGMNGIQFVPVDSAGNYTVLTTNSLAYNRVGIVYMIISKIARRCGEMKLEHKKDNGDIIENSEILAKLKKPNPNQTLSTFIAELASYKLLKGEFYIWTEKGNLTGKTLNYWCVPPNLVTKKQDYYHILNIEVPKEDIFHYRDFVPGYLPYQDATALSPLEVGAINLRILDYASAANFKAIKNGSVQGVAFEKQIPGEMQATPESTKELRDLLIKRYNNPTTHGEVTIHSHEIGYTPFGLKPAELMILENIDFNEFKLADIFNYPRRLLSEKSGSLSGNERQEAKKELITDGVFPINLTICEILSQVFGLDNEMITFDRDSYPEMQIDWLSTSQAVDKMPFLNYNEKRAILGYEPDPNKIFNTIFVPSGLVMADEFESGGSSEADELDNTGDFN